LEKSKLELSIVLKDKEELQKSLTNQELVH